MANKPSAKFCTTNILIDNYLCWGQTAQVLFEIKTKTSLAQSTSKLHLAYSFTQIWWERI